jgi:hypothetical protein
MQGLDGCERDENLAISFILNTAKHETTTIGKSGHYKFL